MPPPPCQHLGTWPNLAYRKACHAWMTDGNSEPATLYKQMCSPHCDFMLEEAAARNCTNLQLTPRGVSVVCICRLVHYACHICTQQTSKPGLPHMHGQPPPGQCTQMLSLAIFNLPQLTRPGHARPNKYHVTTNVAHNLTEWLHIG